MIRKAEFTSACGKIILEDLVPEILVLRLLELIDLLIATEHPVINVEHVSLHDKLDVFLTLIEGGRPLQLFGL